VQQLGESKDAASKGNDCGDGGYEEDGKSGTCKECTKAE